MWIGDQERSVGTTRVLVARGGIAPWPIRMFGESGARNIVVVEVDAVGDREQLLALFPEADFFLYHNGQRIAEIIRNRKARVATAE